MCEETAWVTWQPIHADEFGFTGLMNPCGSRTSLMPAEVDWESLTWQLAQFLVSPGRPLRTHRGKRTSVKSLMLPFRPITV